MTTRRMATSIGRRPADRRLLRAAAPASGKGERVIRRWIAVVITLVVAVAGSVVTAAPASATPTLYPCGIAWPGVYGAIGDHYYYVAGIQPALACPTGWETGGYGVDRMQYFQGGMMYWWNWSDNVPWVGAYATYGDIYGRYLSCGGVFGRLGPPTSDEQNADVLGSFRLSFYLNGYIIWKRSNRATTVYDNGGARINC